MPPYQILAKPALAAGAAGAALMLILNKRWLAGGEFAGVLVAVALFWSIHLIVRIVTSGFLAAEMDRRHGAAVPATKDLQRSTVLRLAGLLLLDFGGLGILMWGVYLLTHHTQMIPFLLAFVAGFTLAQIVIVTTASRTMRSMR